MLLHRHPGFWNGQRKPTGVQAGYTFDPSGRLSNGLLMGIVADGPIGTGMMIDIRRPRTWTVGGTGTPIFASGQYGRQFQGGVTGLDQLTFAPTITDPGSVFSVSTMVLCDGSAHGGFNYVLLGAAAVGTEFCMASGANSSWQCGNLVVGVASSVITMAALSGWHRLGLTCNGTAVRYFLDGKFTDAVTLGGAVSNGNPSTLTGGLTAGNSSFQWPVADFFFWGRTLSDADMATHWAQPYRSVMTARFGELGGSPGVSPYVPAGMVILCG